MDALSIVDILYMSLMSFSLIVRTYVQSLLYFKSLLEVNS